jgi:hypothetical protein
MMIDSAFISVSPLADAIAELHVRDGNQKESNRDRHENNVSHVQDSRQYLFPAITAFDRRLESSRAPGKRDSPGPFHRYLRIFPGIRGERGCDSHHSHGQVPCRIHCSVTPCRPRAHLVRDPNLVFVTRDRDQKADHKPYRENARRQHRDYPWTSNCEHKSLSTHWIFQGVIFV